MNLLSGDQQTPVPPNSLLKVSCFVSPPAKGTSQTFQYPPRSVVNAMVLPSGENLGPVSAAGLNVTCLASVPSRVITQMSPAGFLRLKAIQLPSGDQSGCNSVRLLLVRRLFFALSTSSTQSSIAAASPSI